MFRSILLVGRRRTWTRFLQFSNNFIIHLEQNVIVQIARFLKYDSRILVFRTWFVCDFFFDLNLSSKIKKTKKNTKLKKNIRNCFFKFNFRQIEYILIYIFAIRKINTSEYHCNQQVELE
jgi:hypothetical protein